MGATLLTFLLSLASKFRRVNAGFHMQLARIAVGIAAVEVVKSVCEVAGLLPISHMKLPGPGCGCDLPE